MYLKKVLLIVLLVVITRHTYGQLPAVSPAYHLKGKNYVQLKNYYLLNLLSQSEPVRKMLEHNTTLATLAQKKIGALKTTLNTCTDPLCFTTGIKFSPAEIDTVSAVLTQLYAPGNALGKLVKEQLIPSGAYILYQNLTPAQQLVKAWQQDANGINYAISVYAEGKKPGYPVIDSITFDVKNKQYPVLLYDAAETILAESKNTKLFFTPVLTYALQSLEINERHDAANYEPTATGINQTAFNYIKKLNWQQYKYELILVPGAGPEEPTVALSAEGMLRCRMAAVSYFEGLAPFIMVSGGKAHPYKTKFCEAEEMKWFLIKTLHVPEHAVLAEPHARHTTTNMRNCARIIYRYGMPFTKPCLVITNKSQSAYISDVMPARCQKETQYVPYKPGARLSEIALEFYPKIESLQINPLDPLDP